MPFQGDNEAGHDDLAERRQAARVRQDQLHAGRGRAGALRGDADAQLAGDDLRALGQPEARAAHVHLVPALVDRSADVPDPAEHARQGRQPPHLRRRQRESRPQAQLGGRPRARRRRRLHGRELRRLERGTPRDRDRCDLADVADLPRRRRGHAHAQRHADERRPRRPAGDDRVEGPPSPGDAQPRARPVADGRLLRQADRERRADRLRPLRDPADDARRAEPSRSRDADEHVAGVQLPRLRRERLGRHLVREGRPEHRPPRPHVHPPRRPAAVAQVRRRLPPLAAA